MEYLQENHALMYIVIKEDKEFGTYTVKIERSHCTMNLYFCDHEIRQM